MDLYLIRHADAIALGEKGVTKDAERPLSGDGEAQALALGRALQRRGIVLDTLVSSPLVRAQQTASLMLRGLKSAPELLTTDALAPDAKLRKLAKFLRSQKDDRIGLVGHLPHIGEWAGWLIGDRKTQIDFAKAAVAYIACGELPGKGLGTLHWLITPKWYM